MILYLIFQILPTLAITVYAIYLAYIISSPSRHEAKLKKHEQNPQVQAMHAKLYTPSALMIWAGLAIFSLSGIAFDVYEAMNPSSMMAPLVALITILVLAVVALGVWILVAKDKR